MEEWDAILALVGLAGTPTLALVQWLKTLGLPTRLAPVAALGSGLVMTLLLVAAGVFDVGWGVAALVGVLAGLTASGTFSAVKTLTRG